MGQDMVEGRVCIVTGAGRGLGREHALMLAGHGAKVVVNDLGGSREGTGADAGPAQQVVDEIVTAGGEAAANADDISTWDGAQSLITGQWWPSVFPGVGLGIVVLGYALVGDGLRLYLDPSRRQ